MSDDDWEDTDVSIVLNKNAAPQKQWDDEEEEEDVPAPVVKSAKQIEAEKKKAKDEEIALQIKLQNTLLENETAEQRRIRERKQAEEGDMALFAENLGGTPKISSSSSATTGLGGIPVKTKEDHTKFAILCANKLEQSTSFNVAAFLKEFANRTKAQLTLESLEEIIGNLSQMRDIKRSESNRTNAKAKVTKKELKQKDKAHRDVFGGFEDEDEIDQKYGNYEDDFM